MSVIYQMDFDNTRWSCPWNSDSQLYTKHCQRYGVYGYGVCVYSYLGPPPEQTDISENIRYLPANYVCEQQFKRASKASLWKGISFNR